MRTAYWRAVLGMSCMSPIAPLRETARGLKADSTAMMASTRRALIPCRLAADMISARRLPEGCECLPLEDKEG